MDIQWSLVLFTALTGMGGWLFFFICLNVFVRKTDKGAFAGTATALALTVVGGLASVTHLSHPDRMLGALQHPTSGIFTEALLVGLLAIVMIAFLVMLRRGIDGGALKAVAVVGMALGALMSFMAGQSYLMSAIAAWNTELLPLGYLGTAAASGAAAYLVLIAAQKADENACSLYGLMTLAAGCVALITVLAYGAVAGAFAGDGRPDDDRRRSVWRRRAYRVRLPCPEEAGQRRGAWSRRADCRPYRFDCFPLRYVGYRRRTVRLLRSDLNRPVSSVASRGDGRCRSAVPIPLPDSASASARLTAWPLCRWTTAIVPTPRSFAMTLSLSRRSLVAGSALVAASFAVGSAASALDGGATCLRPPSAEDEERFRSLCLKCDRCRSACPQGCVRTGTLEDGLLNWRTPVMDFHRGLCDFCGRCEQTCPTGAI